MIFFVGGRVVKSVSQFVLLQWQHSRALKNSGAYPVGIYYWRVFIRLLRLSQSGLSWGLCFPLGQLCVSCRSEGAALPTGPSSPRHLLFRGWALPEGALLTAMQKRGDFPRPRVGNWHIIIGQAQSQGRKCTATHDEATARTWMQAGGMNWSQWLNPPQGTTPYIWSYLPHHLHHQPKESSCLLKPLFHQLLNQWVAGYFCLPLPPSLPLPSSKSCLGKKISFAFPSFRIWAKKPCDGQILQQT